MSTDEFKLVLNLNRPNYFAKSDAQPTLTKNALKRKPEPEPSGGIKRQKVSIGQHFRTSSHLARVNKPVLKISQDPDDNFKTPKAQPNLIPNDKGHSGDRDRATATSSSPQPTKKIIKGIRKGSVKFSFSSKTGHYDDNGGSTDKSFPPKTGKRLHLGGQENNAQAKPITSSLFTKNPEIPQFPKSSKSSLSEAVFSAKSFKELNIHPHLQGNLEKLGFDSTTMVQQLSIPLLMKGKDALIKSQTGSGKTLAYAVPLIHKLMERMPRVQRKDGTYAVIIVPTRELAIQTFKCLEKLCKACVWIVPGYLIGGEKKKAEKGRLRKGISILVATPGRLLDHMDTTCSLSLKAVQFLIIDEADRMLEMGYEKSVTKIVHCLDERREDNSESRQTIMLSATLTSAVEKLAGISMDSPVVVDVTLDSKSGGQTLMEDSLATPENLSQYYVIVPSKIRLVTLAAFILSKCKDKSSRKMLVFMTTQDMVDYHTSLFSCLLSRFGDKRKSSLEKRAEKVLSGGQDDPEEGSDMEDEKKQDVTQGGEEAISFLKLHGSMTQSERSAVFKSFSESSAGVLICTDVAARGLDLPRVNWIVQYTAACTAADYVHRVGRTARANTEGSALVFLTPAESSYVSMLESFSIVLKEVQMTLILTSLNGTFVRAVLGFCRNEEVAATRLQIMFEDYVAEDNDMHQMAKAAYVSFIRSYAAYPKQAREIFSFKALHLGHYAKSFGLRDSPQGLGATIPRNTQRHSYQRQSSYPIRTSFSIKPSAMSEFDSGLEPAGRSKKTKKGGKTKKKVSVKGSKLGPKLVSLKRGKIKR